jgi:tetratricopeptide (TPR) repeat protein
VGVVAHLLLSLACLLSGPAFSLASPEEDLGAKSERGKELMAAGRYAEAVPVYRDLVKNVPGNSGLLLNLGMALHLAGQDREALPELQAALRLQPDSLPAALFLGIASLRLGRTAEAVAPLQKAVQLQPDNIDARSALVEALLGVERYAQAEPHLVQLSRLTPKEPSTWFNLGRTYEELAGQAFHDLLKRGPESSFALSLVAAARLKQGRRSAAFHLYRQALDRGPTLRGVHEALAGIYRSAGHPDWAAVEDERERRLPRADCAREPLECGFSAGRYRDVVAAASRSNTPKAYYWLARAYDALAGEALNRLEALPPSALSYEVRAQGFRNEGRFGESAAEWRRAIALAPADTRLKTELAVTLRLDQDFAEAHRILEEVLRAQPGAVEANYLLGDVLLAQQQTERAIPYLERAIRLAPKHAHAQAALGRAYALLGRGAEAIPHLKQGLPADEDGSVRYQLARAYQAAGQTDDAKAALEDYEEFKKAAEADSGGSAQAPITPP